MTFSTRALRLVDAMEKYCLRAKRWDANHLMPPNIKITSAADGCMTGVFKVSEEHCNAGKTLHGGFISSVVDYFSTYAMVQHPRGAIGWTTDMTVMFLSLAAQGESVLVTAKPVKLTKSRAVMECILSKEKGGSLIAKGVVGFSLPAEPLTFFGDIPYDPSIKD